MCFKIKLIDNYFTKFCLLEAHLNDCSNKISKQQFRGIIFQIRFKCILKSYILYGKMKYSSFMLL